MADGFGVFLDSSAKFLAVEIGLRFIGMLIAFLAGLSPEDADRRDADEGQGNEHIDPTAPAALSAFAAWLRWT